jgi:hypothetical protein
MAESYKWYLMCTMVDDNVSIPKDERQIWEGKWLAACDFHFRLDTPPGPFHFTRFGPRVPYTFTWFPKFDVFHVDLIQALEIGNSRRFRFGWLLDKYDERIPDYRVVTSKHRIPIRGSSPIGRCRRCPGCGQVFHSPMYPWRLLRRDIPRADVSLSNGASGFLISSRVHQRLKETGPWKKVRFVPLRVIDTPEDGLPEDLNDFVEPPKKEKRKKK